MRLIDADTIKLEKGFFENIDNVPKFFEWLGKQPTVTEVVRCKDCKYSRPYRLDKYTCEKEHDCGDYTVPADWFCADGERKSDS